MSVNLTPNLNCEIPKMQLPVTLFPWQPIIIELFAARIAVFYTKLSPRRTNTNTIRITEVEFGNARILASRRLWPHIIRMLVMKTYYVPQDWRWDLKHSIVLVHMSLTSHVKTQTFDCIVMNSQIYE